MAKILLAEDDAAMRHFLAAALKKAGHHVVGAANGGDALHYLEKDGDFDMVLTDIVMPGMDGIELAQKAQKTVKGIKVMFITGFSAVSVGKRHGDRDTPRVLSKPFHLKDLVDQVTILLGE